MKTNRQTLSTPTSAAGVSGDSPNGAGGGFSIYQAITIFSLILATAMVVL